MPKVALIIDDFGAVRTQVAAALRKHLNADLGQVLKAMDEKAVVLERPLYPRDDPMFSARFLATLEALDKLPIVYTAYELLDGQLFKDQPRNTLYRITTDRLKTMIDARQKSLRQIRDQGRREDGSA